MRYRCRNTSLALAIYSPATVTGKNGDQSRRRVPVQALASSLYICELLVFRLPLYLANPFYYNSTYNYFPFFTPEKSTASLTRQGIADKYTFTRPVPVSLPNILNTSLASRPSSGPCPLQGPIWDEGSGSVLDRDEKTGHDAGLALVSVLIFVVIAARNDTYTNIVDLTCYFH